MLGQLFGQCLAPVTTIHTVKTKSCSDVIRPAADTWPVVAVLLVGFVLMLALVGAVLDALIRRAIRARRS
jgi:hypothetical protein